MRSIQTLFTITLLLLEFVAHSSQAAEQKAPTEHTASRAPASIQSDDPNRAIDVKGQTRNWNRLVGGRGDRDSIDFVKQREDFRPEIEGSGF